MSYALLPNASRFGRSIAQVSNAALGSCCGRRFGFQVAHQSGECFLVRVMIFPLAEISDVTHPAKRRRPCLVAIHHGIIYAYREENKALLFMLAFERAFYFLFNPRA